MNTYRIIIDDISFEQGEGTAPFYWTGKVRGFGKSDIRTSSAVNSGSDGGYIGDQLLDFRRIPLDLFVYSEDLDEVEKASMLMTTKLRHGVDLPIRLITPTGRQFVIPKARVIVNEPIVSSVKMIDYHVELLSGDPAIYDYTSGEASRIKLEKIQRGGIEWEEDGIAWDSDGIIWTDSTGDKQVENLGNTAVYPLITIKGSVTNPKFTNSANGRVLSINITTSPSDEIKIDFLTQEITLNDLNIYYNLNDDDFWPINPGVNTIIYTSDSNNDEAVIELEWYNGYTGVM